MITSRTSQNPLALTTLGKRWTPSQTLFDSPRSRPRASDLKPQTAHSDCSEDFPTDIGASPPISHHPSRSVSTSSSRDAVVQVEIGSILRARAECKRVLLEVILHLQEHPDWPSADDAWEVLVERLSNSGFGRHAQRDAEVLWEFAFQANPLEHFGSILSQSRQTVEQMIPSLSGNPPE